MSSTQELQLDVPTISSMRILGTTSQVYTSKYANLSIPDPRAAVKKSLFYAREILQANRPREPPVK